MIEVFDRGRRRVAILENAYNIKETQKKNSLWYFYFSLPYNDSKRKYCQPFYYVRHDGGELYRIMPEELAVEETGGVSYQCEHVLATLIDNILFGYHVVGNRGYYTPAVIRYILDHQIEKNWVLDECDFRNQFEYGWEQESLLSALFSVLSPLKAPILVTDTSVYPWRLSLKRLENGRPEMYIRRHHNLTSYNRGRDPQQIVTRLYPLGYGEGVNQLGIASVNNGVPYLESPPEIAEKYGIIERAWIDRRYENAESLKAAAAEMLAELQEPLVSYQIGFEELDTSEYDKAAIGKRVRIIYPEIGEEYDTYITEITRNYDDVKSSSFKVENKPSSISSYVSDMADRQRIEQTYAQGATQIYSQAVQANSDAKNGAIMDFFLPEEMRIVNKVLVKVRLKPFRAYSQATTSAASQTITSTTTDDQTRTSAGGGKTTQTTTSTDDVTRTSAGGGKTTRTTTSTDDVTKTSAGGGKTTRTTTSTDDVTRTSAGGGKTTRTTTSTDDQTRTSAGGGKTTQTTTSTDDETRTSSAGGSTITSTGSGGGDYKTTSSTQQQTTTSSSTVLSAENILPADASTFSAAIHNHAIPRGAKIAIWGGNKDGLIVSGGYYEWQPSGAHSHGAHDHTITIPGHSHSVTIDSHTHSITLPSHTHNVMIYGHSHKVTIPEHTHNVTIPGHSHKVDIPEHTHNVTIPGHSHKVDIPEHTHNVTIPGHSHKVDIPEHTHNVTIPGHSHKVTIPEHTHNVTIPGHSHKVTIPAHSHSVTPGIFEFGNPQKFAIYINGTKKADFAGRTAELDITNYLIGSDDKIPRGSWLSLEVRPDDLAYISIDLIVQGFIQSRGDNTV